MEIRLKSNALLYTEALIIKMMIETQEEKYVCSKKRLFRKWYYERLYIFSMSKSLVETYRHMNGQEWNFRTETGSLNIYKKQAEHFIFDGDSWEMYNKAKPPCYVFKVC